MLGNVMLLIQHHVFGVRREPCTKWAGYNAYAHALHHLPTQYVCPGSRTWMKKAQTLINKEHTLKCKPSVKTCTLAREWFHVSKFEEVGLPNLYYFRLCDD